jgi:solute carrier family 25 protein 39/40
MDADVAAAVEKGIAAAFGSTITALLMTPLDVTKTRQQSGVRAGAGGGGGLSGPSWPLSAASTVSCARPGRGGGGGGGAMTHAASCVAASCTNLANRRPVYPSGALATLRFVLRHEGPGALWGGLSPTLMTQVPSTTVFFVMYEEIKRAVVRYADRSGGGIGGGLLRDAAPMIASVSARVLTVLAAAPVELVRTQMQFARSRVGVWRSLVRLVDGGGSGALWRGATASLARDIPFAGVYWTAYEAWKPALSVALFRRGGGGGGGGGGSSIISSSSSVSSSLSWGESFVAAFGAGWAAGLLAAFVTTPMDVVKTRRQIGLTATALSRRGYSVGRELRAIARAEGLGGLFAGIGPRLAKVGPTCAIMISSYELGKRYFNVYT